MALCVLNRADCMNSAAKSTVPASAEVPALPPTQSGSRRLRILVVDDNPSVRRIIATGLQGDGHDVETAEDGVGGLALHTAQPFDIVLTDLIMPGMRGRELAVAVKRLDPRTPVILITGFNDEIPDSPFDFIILKPFPQATLRAAVEILCGCTEQAGK